MIKVIKKIFVFIIIFLMLTTYIQNNRVKGKIFSNNSDILNLLVGGHLEIYDGVKILYINGSYYELGFQHGYLLKDEVQENVRAFIDHVNKVNSYYILLDMWNTTKQFIPTCYIEEMQGIADGAYISIEDLAVSYMTVLYMDMQCFTYVAWADATEDKRLYHIRSMDFSLEKKDPISGKYVQENSILIVRKPKDGLMSIIPSFSGWINAYSGVNEKQITIGVQVSWSKDQTIKGIPAQFRIQQIMDSASDINEGIGFLTSNKTLGWNFIISDAKTNIGYAVETTANHSYLGTWDNPFEKNKPFWQIKNVVRRTNFFIEPTMASTQRDYYSPSGLLGFLRLFKGDGFFLLWRKYKSMSLEIEKNWGKINLNSSISLLREVYTGKTDIFLLIFIRTNTNSIFCDFHQWTVCPESGEFVISFADSINHSHKTKLHYFNINELFEKEFT